MSTGEHAVVSSAGGHPLQQRIGTAHHAIIAPTTTPVSSVPHGFLPSFLAGAPSLVEQLDKKLLIVLRDGTHLIGVLRSFDQFTNFVLEDTVERKFCTLDDNDKYYYSDKKLGLYLVRGDSIVLLGELEEVGSVLEQQGCEVSSDELEKMIEKQKSEGGKLRQEHMWDFDMDLL